MAQTIRFHLDEHVSPVVADGLRRRGIDATTTRVAGLLGADDDAQLAYCRTQGRVLFTSDDDFLRLHEQGIDHAGIVYCRQQSRSIGDMIRGLELLWEVLEPEEMRRKVEFL